MFLFVMSTAWRASFPSQIPMECICYHCYRCGPPALACSFGQVVIFTAHARYLLWIIFSLYEKINLNDPHGGPPQLHTKLIWQGARAVLYNSKGS